MNTFPLCRLRPGPVTLACVAALLAALAAAGCKVGPKYQRPAS